MYWYFSNSTSGAEQKYKQPEPPSVLWSISEKLKDAKKWGDFYRTKVICDWYALWPEKFGVGYLKKKAA